MRYLSWFSVFSQELTAGLHAHDPAAFHFQHFEQPAGEHNLVPPGRHAAQQSQYQSRQRMIAAFRRQVRQAEPVLDLIGGHGAIQYQHVVVPQPLGHDNVLVLDGAMPADEVKDRLGLSDLPAEGSYHTLAGLILALLRRVPARGDKVVFSGWLFEVLEMEGRRVVRVQASRQLLAEN